MRRPFVLLTLVLVMATALPLNVQAGASPVLRIMAAGDSITMGQDGPTPAAPYPAVDWVGYRKPLSEALAPAGYHVQFVGSQANGCAAFVQCLHEGHGGWTISLIDQHIAEWMTAQNPDLILLHAGTPDMFAADAATAPARLEALLAHIQALNPSVGVVFTSIPPIADVPPVAAPNVVPFNAALPAIAARRQAAGQRIVLVDPGLDDSNLYDHLHPNESGYAKIAAAMLGGIESLPEAADSNVDLTLLPSAARTVTQSITIGNRAWLRGLIYLNVTAVPGGGQTLQVFVTANDPATGLGERVLIQGPTVSAVAATTYTISPGLTSDAMTSGLFLPRKFSINVIHSGAGAWTYSLGASLVR